MKKSNEREQGALSPAEKAVKKIFKPLAHLIYHQKAAGIALSVMAGIALILANSPFAHFLADVGNLKIGVIFENSIFALPIKEWISSGLMSLFFLVLGLEIKRETLAGQLRHPQQIILIILASIGGIVFPALIYAAINLGTSTLHGWAIPTSTDTAFAIGFMALLARRISHSVTVFLITLAILDDIAAIIIITLFYAHEIHMPPLGGAVLAFTCLLGGNFAGVRNNWFYIVFGFILWGFVYSSGIHATLAGILMAITIPARTHLGQKNFIEEVRALVSIFEKGEAPGIDMLGSQKQHAITADMTTRIQNVSTPLQRWEMFLIVPISIIVMPLFALFNAGVPLSWEEIAAALSSPVTLGIFLGLVLGKPLGIFFFVYTGLRLKLGQLPSGISLKEIVGSGFVAGIGFTMSLFITELSFTNAVDQNFAKIGILLASVTAALAGSLWFLLACKKLRVEEPGFT